MEITKNQTDSLNARLTLSIAAADYADKRRKLLNDYRRKADIKGFRKGMAPMSLIERIYGQSALVDSVNGIISESLDGYIRENRLNIIGEPLPAEDQKENEWTAGGDFEFAFDIALYPEFTFETGPEDHIPYYNILPTDEAKKEMKDNLLKQYGNLEDGEAVGPDDFIIADILQGGQTKVEGTYVSLRNVAEECRDKFIGLKPGESVEIDTAAAFKSEEDRATMLHVKKEELAALDPVHTFTVKSVKTFKDAELNQETFDKIFGPGNVTSEEQFDEKIAGRLAAEYTEEANHRFMLDAKKFYLEKSHVELPAAFMKRWLLAANEGKYTTEQIDEQFDGFVEDFKWQCVRDYIASTHGVKVEQSDLEEGARQMAAYQFAMYGMYDVPQEQLGNFAKRLLDNEQDRRNIAEQCVESKVAALLRTTVTLDTKDVTLEEFREISAK